MAALIDVSARHLGRMFVTDVGLTPMQYVDLVRLEAACVMLCNGSEPLETIARRCGIGTSESLRRLFRRELGTTPSAYRLHHRLRSPGDHVTRTPWVEKTASAVRASRHQEPTRSPTGAQDPSTYNEGEHHGCHH